MCTCVFERVKFALLVVTDNYFHSQETFWRIPVSLNPQNLRNAANELRGKNSSDNHLGSVFHFSYVLSTIEIKLNRHSVL